MGMGGNYHEYRYIWRQPLQSYIMSLIISHLVHPKIDMIPGLVTMIVIIGLDACFTQCQEYRPREWGELLHD